MIGTSAITNWMRAGLRGVAVAVDTLCEATDAHGVGVRMPVVDVHARVGSVV
jgi:hypothetical protein